MHRSAAPSSVQLPPRLDHAAASLSSHGPRPANPRTQSSSSIRSQPPTSPSPSSSPFNQHRLSSASASASASPSAGAAAGARARDSPGNSSNRSSYATQDEIEASLKQWRNHVFPSLKAGHYVSPAGELDDGPDKEREGPAMFPEPLLPGIFETGASNAVPWVERYATGREFLSACSSVEEGVLRRNRVNRERERRRDEGYDEATARPSVSGMSEASGVDDQVIGGGEEEEGQDNGYFSNWRLEMILGQTSDLVHLNERAEGIWMALWSGSEADGTLLLEFCLMKLPSRPLVLSSPIPIPLLPTAFLQERSKLLLDGFLAHPSVVVGGGDPAQPFSLVMGPTRLVAAFLLHYDAESAVPVPDSGTVPLSGPSPALVGSGIGNSSTLQDGSRKSNSLHLGTGAIVPFVPGGSSPGPGTPSGVTACSSVASVKPLIHARVDSVPPAVSLSDGFVVRLADASDDLATLTRLFQAYSGTLEIFLDEYQARKALTKAMAASAVWIYYLYSVNLPGLTLIAGFLTTERIRRADALGPDHSHSHSRGGNSAAITAVYTEENYRGRGVAESLVRTAVRHYLVDQAGFESLSVYVDPRNETAVGVFSRVGFGLGEREERERIPVRAVREALEQQQQRNARREADASAQQGMGMKSPSSASASASPSLPSPVSASSSQDTPTSAKPPVDSLSSAASPGSGRPHPLPSGLVDSATQHDPERGHDAAGEETPEEGLWCSSKEDWQVVTLRRSAEQNVQSHPRAQTFTHSAAGGSPSGLGGRKGRRDANRLSSDGPWY